MRQRCAQNQHLVTAERAVRSFNRQLENTLPSQSEKVELAAGVRRLQRLLASIEASV